MSSTAELHRKVRSALPDKAGRLMDEIEARAGFSVQFEQKDSAPDPDMPDPLAWESQFSESKAVIRAHSFETVDTAAAIHELLHIHRALVEGVPQLLPIKGMDGPANSRACSHIENTLEHLVIVPREKDYGIDSAPRWNASALKFWQNHPWPAITSPEGKRNNALLARLELELTSAPDIRALAATCLRAERLTYESERFVERISQFLSEKPRSVSSAVRFLKFPPEHLRLVYFDPRRRSRR